MVCGLLERLLAEDHELVTLIEGAEAATDVTDAVREWLAGSHPEVALEVHHGGQPLYPYLLAVE